MRGDLETELVVKERVKRIAEVVTALAPATV